MPNLPATPPSPKTKIVATVGPASRDEPQLAALIEAGVDVFRLNAAHGSIEEHDATLRTIRRLSHEAGRPIGVLVDLAGPKIRLGELVGGQVECRAGETVWLVRGEMATRPGELVSNYPKLIDELEVGKSVMLADGTVGLLVEEVTAGDAKLRVTQSGLVRSRQGINLPGAKLSLPAMSDADRRHAEWAAKAGVDFIGLSFVRSGKEVRELKSLLHAHNSSARVVAKIEKQEALNRLMEIVTAADCLMVARGDLGVEIDLARMPVVQKEIVALCNQEQKPVIVATQMLESMQHARRPTRAEATDVANAILDGCDACMLSGETAIGEYPREAVEMMNRIALATEEVYRKHPTLHRPETLAGLRIRSKLFSRLSYYPIRILGDEPVDWPGGLPLVTQAVVRAAGLIAQGLDARLIAVASHSGATALALSKLRSFVPTVGVSDREEVVRQMCLMWGVIPLSAAPTEDNSALLAHVTEWGRRAGLLSTGDQIVLVAGTGLPMQGHNMVLVREVGK